MGQCQRPGQLSQEQRRRCSTAMRQIAMNKTHERCLKSVKALFVMILVLGGLMYCQPPCYGATQSYVIEDINDPEFKQYPPPKPARACEASYVVKTKDHTETIPIRSTRLRNLSVTLENTGSGTIQAPWLFGSQGYDARSQKQLVDTITHGSQSDFERFVRVHEWVGLHMWRCEGDITHGRVFDPMLNINRHGNGMCGATAAAVASLLYHIPGVHGRTVVFKGHMVGEANVDGKWCAYDSSMRWIYFGRDNKTPVSWKEIYDDKQLQQRSVMGWVPRLMSKQSPSSWTYNNENADLGQKWDFTYALHPNEKVTMYFDMRGRVDRTSYGYNKDAGSRNPCDYGSAIFCYKPDLTGEHYKKCVVEENNIKQTETGLVAVDPNKPASIVFEVHKGAWTFAGSDITADFKTNGKVYISTGPSGKGYPKYKGRETRYAKHGPWQLLSKATKEYPQPIEGMMAYWIKVEFQGKDAGLNSIEINSEVAMNPYIMPDLAYGENKIRFDAADMGGSTLKITHRYDDRSPYHTYQPAKEDYGRHLYFRVGGGLMSTQSKPKFWQALRTNPRSSASVAIDIYQVTGVKQLTKVKSSRARNLGIGYYTLYWNGRNDAGKRCEPNQMYYVRVGGQARHVERLYLYPYLWPIPNETRRARMAKIEGK